MITNHPIRRRLTHVVQVLALLLLCPITAFAQGEIRKPAERPLDPTCSTSTEPSRTAGAGMLLTCLDGTIYSGNGSTWTKTGSGGGSGVGSASPTQVLRDDAGSVDGDASFIHNVSALSVPAVPVLVKVGAGTGTTWGYTVVAKTLVGGSEPSTEATIDGNATLDGTHSITVTPPACATRVTAYDVYRTTAGGTPSTTGLIAQDVACSVPLADTGLDYLYPVYAPSSSDFSTGIGASTPLVVTSHGSFGSLAAEVWNDNQPFAAQPGIISIAERSSLLPGPYALSVNVVVDADSYVSNAFVRDVAHDISDFGQHPNILTVTYDGNSGTGYAVNNLIGVQASHFLTRVGSIATSLTGFQDYSSVNLGSAGAYYGFYEYVPQGTGVIANLFGFYSQALSSRGTNAYSFWSDEQGVFRIKADNTFNAVYQAIPAGYNPQVTKYVPGASDFERWFLRWNTNVAEVGTEKGGSGTVRNLRLIGGGLEFGSTLVAPASSGTRYLCISTAGVVTSSSSACSGT